MISMITLWLLYGGLFAMATAQECTFTWKEYTDQRAYGGIVNVFGTTEANCRSQCESDPNCVTYDFTPQEGLPCFTHSDNSVESRVPTAGTNHYQYEGTCTLVNGTNCRFRYVGQNEYPADLAASPGITSEDECLLDCVSKPTCISSSFVPGGTCQLSALTTNALNGRTRLDGRRQYLKDLASCVVVTTNYTAPTNSTAGPPCNQSPADCEVRDRSECQPPSPDQLCGIGYMWEIWRCPNAEPRKVKRFCCLGSCIRDPCNNPRHKHLRCPTFGDKSGVTEGECWEAGCCWDEHNPWGIQCHIKSTNDLSCDKVFPRCEQ